MVIKPVSIPSSITQPVSKQTFSSGSTTNITPIFATPSPSQTEGQLGLTTPIVTGGGNVVAQPIFETFFNNTTNWTLVGDYHEFSVTEDLHRRTRFLIQVYELISDSFELVQPLIIIQSNLTVVIRAVTPFAGKISIA